MTWIEIKAMKEARAKVGAEAQKLVEVAGKETRSLTGDESATFDKLTADYNNLGKQIAFVEKRATEAKPEFTNELVGEDKGEDKAAEARTAYLRGRATPEQRSMLKFENGMLEFRALTTSGIGQVGTKVVASAAVKTLKDFSGVLSAGATILNTSNGNPFTVVKINDTGSAAEVLGENTQTASNTDPTIGNVTFNGYTYSSKVILVPNQLVDDNEFNLESYIMQIADERIGRLFNTHTTTGDDSGKPNGFTVAASAGKTAASATALTFGELVDFIHSVDPAYRLSPNFAIQAHDNVIAAVRKMVDSNGEPLWKPNDKFDNILGVKFIPNNAMASSLAASAKAMAAGDWTRYYCQMVNGVRVLRLVERYADYNQTGFVVFKRLDGDLVDTSAVKLLVMAAS